MWTSATSKIQAIYIIAITVDVCCVAVKYVLVSPSIFSHFSVYCYFSRWMWNLMEDWTLRALYQKVSFKSEMFDDFSDFHVISTRLVWFFLFSSFFFLKETSDVICIIIYLHIYVFQYFQWVVQDSSLLTVRQLMFF